MPNYPDWVLKHKKKGTYINVQNGKYYLYAAHSERVPGTGKVRRVSDGYLGRITEAGGFIPAKKKLDKPLYVYEYGLSETVLSVCANISSGIKREFRANADYVMVSGILQFMHGGARQEYYESSWLSVRFPGLRIGKDPTDKQRVGIERVERMVADVLSVRFGDELPQATSLLPLIKAVRMGNETAMSVVPGGVADFLEAHGLHLGGEVHYG